MGKLFFLVYNAKFSSIFRVIITTANKIPLLRDKLKEYVFIYLVKTWKGKEKSFSIKNLEGNLDLEEEIIYSKLKNIK
ncbi:hypothetical protein [Aquifex aeolicus]|uniref:hypothetical protein n=1 Tax=Aquifex aeolicus TaxID=63363 RepID=UPI0013E8C18E|nr:hypothetical protein [Aquifex aeolicus]